MKRITVLLAFAVFLLMPTSTAAAECQFVLGFKTLRDLIGHDIVGECLENQHYDATGDGLQQTTGGLLVWRKADNWTAFTDGYRTWISGPNGLVQRLNTERFAWEADYAPGGGIATPPPKAVPPSNPTLIPSPTPTLTTQPATSDGLKPTPIPIAELTPPTKVTLVPTPSPTPTTELTPNSQPTPANVGQQSASVVTVSLAEKLIAALPWVRDGVTGSKEGYATQFLRSLAKSAPSVFLAWMEEYGENAKGGQHSSKLYHLSRVAASDEWAAVRMVKMPFMEPRESRYDYSLLNLMADLEETLPGTLRQVLSLPELQGRITDQDAPTLVLLALQHGDPEVAKAVKSLRWVQDGVAINTQEGPLDHRFAKPSQFEFSALIELTGLRLGSRQAFLNTVGFPWLQDEIVGPEHTLIDYLDDFAAWDGEVARQLTAMPFLKTLESHDHWIMDSLRSLFFDDREALREILSSPQLAGGITIDRMAVFALLVLERQNPRVASTIRSLPWVEDGISDADSSGIQALRLAAESEQVFFALAQKRWVRDGLSENEQLVINRLMSIAGSVARRDEAAALRILNMPFLDSIDEVDIAAVSALSRLHWAWGPNQGILQEVLSHPSLRRGIRDDQAAVISVLSIVADTFPDMVFTLLKPGEARVWERRITLREAGNVRLAVVSTSPDASRNLDWLEHAVRHHATFMGAPFPNTYVALWVHERGGGGGGPSGTLSVGSVRSPAIIAHEAAHVYWPFPPLWIAEGAASFLEAASENSRIGTPIKAYNDGRCSLTDTLSGLDRIARKGGTNLQNCEYSLGSALFVDLYRSLGNEAFREGFRSLYLKLRDEELRGVCQREDLGVCYVKAAFVTDAPPRVATIAERIINRRYYGSK